MWISGAVALVTGANRGLGASFTQALLARGAATVYAAARDASMGSVTDPRVKPIDLDITDRAAVAAVAQRCGDVDLLVNNAGAMLLGPLITAPDTAAARTEMEVNYFGTLEMCRAFAPVLARNGGGALVNMLSVVSWYTVPFNASYCASKSAEWALTNAARVELHGQGTHVVGVHAGFIDTDMAADVSEAKIAPEDVVAQALDAVENNVTEVITDEWTRHVKSTLPVDQEELYPDLRRAWAAGASPWGRD
ncbi:SDR family oxidoreductase [Streptomyces sp. NPDC087228]|uniref:SDR family oxidoreductase n=1 Tax=Streptomyces sp. NPDC087228 TaxID=3365772 RepID=UPI00381582BA